MTDKRIINNFISKYHLGGVIEKVKWVSDGDTLKVEFINDSQTLAGCVVTRDFQFPQGEFGIYSTSTLNKLLSILDNEVMFEVKKTDHVPSKYFIADTNVDVTFNLADLQVIPKVPKINLGDDVITINLNSEFITNFIKSRDALGEEIFFVTTQEGFTSPEVQFIIGDSFSNSVSFAAEISNGSHHQLNRIPFNALLVKEIFKHNKNFEEGVLLINPKGLITFTFKFGFLESNYYLVRNQN